VPNTPVTARLSTPPAPPNRGTALAICSGHHVARSPTLHSRQSFSFRAQNDYNLAPSRTLYGSHEASKQTPKFESILPTADGPEGGHSLPYRGAEHLDSMTSSPAFWIRTVSRSSHNRKGPSNHHGHLMRFWHSTFSPSPNRPKLCLRRQPSDKRYSRRVEDRLFAV